MNTEQMRAEFEAWAVGSCGGVLWGTDRYSYKSPAAEFAWRAWQACCKKQEDRIAESTLELSDLLEGALVALEQREDAPPYPLFSTKTEETLLDEIMEMKRKLADKREFVVELPKAELIGSYLDHPANTRINVYKLPVLETIAAIEAAGGSVK